MNTKLRLDLYLNYLESIFMERDIKKSKRIWEKTIAKKKLLKYASKFDETSFKSNIIVEKILEEKKLYDTEIYNDLINIIYNNKIIQRKKTILNSSNTFLTTTLYNENLILNDSQKKLVVSEAENCQYVDKHYKREETKVEYLHGSGLTDLRYRILCNVSFSEDEKNNLVKTFYPDDEMKLAILKELEWNIVLELKLNNYDDNYDEIYDLEINNLSKSVISKINLCKYIKSILPPTLIKRYKNNE